MGKTTRLLAVLALLAALSVAVSARKDDERWSERERGREEERWSERERRGREEARGGDEGGTGWREGDDWFLLHRAKPVVKTEAGSMKLVRGSGISPMHIGFITMEPKSLFIPQYLDSSLILFVRRGIISSHIFDFSVTKH